MNYKMYLYSILFRVAGAALCPLINFFCLLLGAATYPKFLYYLDNAEDGYTGDRRNWYSDYLGHDIQSKGFLYTFYRSVRWCWRNMAFNHRYSKLAGVNITNPTNLTFEGNTYHHEARYSFEPNVRERKWYKVTGHYDGRYFESHFELVPIDKKWSWSKLRFIKGNFWKYRRWGLKIYPGNYWDTWWQNKIANDGWPKFKTHGVMTNIRRVRDE